MRTSVCHTFDPIFPRNLRASLLRPLSLPLIWEGSDPRKIAQALPTELPPSCKRQQLRARCCTSQLRRPGISRMSRYLSDLPREQARLRNMLRQPLSAFHSRGIRTKHDMRARRKNHTLDALPAQAISPRQSLSCSSARFSGDFHASS